MNCAKIKKLIPIYLDGRLEDKKCRDLKNHVSGCPVCQREVEAYQRSWQMLGQWEDIQPTSGYVGRFWTAVSQQMPWHEQLLKALRVWFFQKRLAPVFVAICVLLVIGVFSLHNYWQMVETGELLASLNTEELEMAENIDLAENLDIIQDMDFLEDLEVIEGVEIQELI